MAEPWPVAPLIASYRIIEPIHSREYAHLIDSHCCRSFIASATNRVRPSKLSYPLAHTLPLRDYFLHHRRITARFFDGDFWRISVARLHFDPFLFCFYFGFIRLSFFWTLRFAGCADIFRPDESFRVLRRAIAMGVGKSRVPRMKVRELLLWKFCSGTVPILESSFIWWISVWPSACWYLFASYRICAGRRYFSWCRICIPDHDNWSVHFFSSCFSLIFSFNLFSNWKRACTLIGRHRELAVLLSVDPVKYANEIYF